MLSRYDLKDTSKIVLVDIQLIAAMGPPGGGRNPVTPRFIRHFNICTINTFSDETMVRIFSSIVAFYFRTRDFPPEYFLVGNQIVSGTMEVSKECRKKSLILHIPAFDPLVFEFFFFLSPLAIYFLSSLSEKLSGRFENRNIVGFEIGKSS